MEGVPPGFFAPVLPVLHDDVDRDVPAAVFADHAGQFVEALVAFARLPEPESPFRKHRRRAGQRTVAAHASCGIAPVDEPVIDGVAHLRREFESVASVAELRGRVVVPQQSEAARGDQIGVDDVFVGLQQQDRVAFVVQGARLVLAQSVQRLVVGPGRTAGSRRSTPRRPRCRAGASGRSPRAAGRPCGRRGTRRGPACGRTPPGAAVCGTHSRVRWPRGAPRRERRARNPRPAAASRGAIRPGGRGCARCFPCGTRRGRPCPPRRT